METNEQILDSIIDKFMAGLPKEAFNDFRSKRDCPDRNIVLAAMKVLSDKIEEMEAENEKRYGL